ncbi:MAG: sulfate reduction electron transfer complex DsrMKJOP subunit DsrM [Thermodesulfobacteriota bacterium]|nr:sulfate reduction electron transfer complex DsrMKJOP subunit DsrM [Thermodesulfobacteriota bacterium]
MGASFSLLVVLILVFTVFIGVGVAGFNSLFGVVIPYAALVIFFFGCVLRVRKWAKSPVPFRITTTCGQQKSHPWIKSNNLESPYNTFGVIGRMALEVLFFRSLFRNTRAELRDGPRVVYGGTKWLWLAGLVFHWSFLLIILRHLRFFTEPVPIFVNLLEGMDGLFELGVPTLYMTDIAIVLAVTYLFLRRVVIPQIRYISIAADYFPLFLILGVALSGVLMRHFFKVDILKVKELATGLFTFHPVVPDGIGVSFYIHLFLVSALLIYFPFSKLMHMGGVFLSPTRNMPNDNRSNRHINPWNYPVKVHPYAEYENEFREKMKAAGLPVEKE